jgi:hypothetical protein
MRNGCFILFSFLGFLACSDNRLHGGDNLAGGGHGGTAGGSGGAPGPGGASGSGNAGGAGGTDSTLGAARLLFLDPVDPSGSLQSDREYTVTVTGASDDGSLLAGTASFGNLNLWPATGANFYWTARSGVVKLDQPAAGSVDPSPRVSPDGTVIYGWYHGGDTGVYQWSPSPGYRLVSFGAGVSIDPGSALISADGNVALGAESGGAGGIFRWRSGNGLVELSSLPGWPATAVYGVLDVSGSGVQSPSSDDGSLIAAYTQRMSGDFVLTSPFLWTDAVWRVDVGLTGFDSCGITAVSRDGSAAVGACFNTGVTAISDRSTAFRWTAATGTVSLGPGFYSEISADGGVAVGGAESGALFRWTAQSGAVTLQPPPSTLDPAHWSLQITPGSLSSDGQTFHGSARRIDFQPTVDQEIPSQAFRWSATEGFVVLAPLAGNDVSAVTAAARDGSVLVGVSRSTIGSASSSLPRAALWDCRGTRDIAGELTAAGVDLHGMQLGWGETVNYVWSGASIMMVYEGTTYHPPWIAWLPNRCP